MSEWVIVPRLREWPPLYVITKLYLMSTLSASWLALFKLKQYGKDTYESKIEEDCKHKTVNSLSKKD